MWLKIKQEGLRRLWSIFPLTRVPFWYRFSEPQPNGNSSFVFFGAIRVSDESRGGVLGLALKGGPL